jgi:hypothetical protein
LDEAYAVPPASGSGSIRLRTKSIGPGQDLECDLNHPDSDIEIIAEIGPPPSFTLQGVVICQEFDDEEPVGVPSAFNLTQIFMSPINNGFNGLVFRTQSVGDGDDELLIWEFIVSDSYSLPNEVLEWRLQPVNSEDPVCEVAYENCINRWGVPSIPLQTQFPDRDVTGDMVNDFGAAGVVFRYTELRLANGNRISRPLLLGPCHNGDFDIERAILCEVTLEDVPVPTTAAGNVAAAGVVGVVITPDTFNVKNKTGTHHIIILGEENLNRPPVVTLEVNGKPILFTSHFADVNKDGFIDFDAKVERKAFGAALDCSGNGQTEVEISGTLSPEGRFTGKDTINVIHCPN